MKIPDPETLRISAISHLRELNSDEEAALLNKCKLEIGSIQRYSNTAKIGLNITLRCRSADIIKCQDKWGLPSQAFTNIQAAIKSVLPVEITIDNISARSFIIDRSEFEKTELERLIETQKNLMITVATGGPKIDTKNEEYKERRTQIKEKLDAINKKDPNSFEDLWSWYGRWSSGDLPSWQSRREYIKNLYQSILEDLAGADISSPLDPRRDPTGWEKVDRIVDGIITQLGKASREEEYQTVGLLCRECLISLALAVYKPEIHKTADGLDPSKTDAFRMLEAYFSYEYSGSQNEALRRHAKASLSLANELQHNRTAEYKDAALCSEATRTVVNIVAITSGKR